MITEPPAAVTFSSQAAVASKIMVVAGTTPPDTGRRNDRERIVVDQVVVQSGHPDGRRYLGGDPAVASRQVSSEPPTARPITANRSSLGT